MSCPWVENKETEDIEKTIKYVPYRFERVKNRQAVQPASSLVSVDII